jgi:hypothetical protein
VAGVEGLEPPTPGFGDRCSGQLSYTPTGPRIRRVRPQYVRPNPKYGHWLDPAANVFGQRNFSCLLAPGNARPYRPRHTDRPPPNGHEPVGPRRTRQLHMRQIRRIATSNGALHKFIVVLRVIVNRSRAPIRVTDS